MRKVPQSLLFVLWLIAFVAVVGVIIVLGFSAAFVKSSLQVTKQVQSHPF